MSSRGSGYRPCGPVSAPETPPANSWHHGVVGNTVAPDLVTVIQQLLNRLLFQSASHVAPEIDGRLKLLHIIFLQPLRKRIQQKFRVRFPGMSLRQRELPISHGLGFTVDSAKLAPCTRPTSRIQDLRIDHPIKIQTVFCRIVKRRSYPHLTRLQPRHIIEII